MMYPNRKILPMKWQNVGLSTYLILQEDSIMEQNNNFNQPYVYPALDEHKRRCTTPLVLGIISCIVAWYPIFSIAGIVCGAIGLKQSSDNRKFAAQNQVVEHGMNKGAFITSIIGTIASALMTLFYIAAIALGFFALNLFFESNSIDSITSMLLSILG